MDLRLRQLEIAYLQNGDIEAGVQLLKALVRSGKVPWHHLELAAIYQHPIAMELVGEESARFGHRDEERVLPLTNVDFETLELWDCEVYHRRLLAVTQWCYQKVLGATILRKQIEDEVCELLSYVREILDTDEEHDPKVIREIFARVMEYSQDFLSMSNRDLAIYRMLLTVGATIRALDCNNNHDIITISGPAWACASVAHLDVHLGLRDPDLPENPEQGFGPLVIEGAYTAIAEETVPWLLDPFPC